MAIAGSPGGGGTDGVGSPLPYGGDEDINRALQQALTKDDKAALRYVCVCKCIYVDALVYRSFLPSTHLVTNLPTYVSVSSILFQAQKQRASHHVASPSPNKDKGGGSDGKEAKDDDNDNDNQLRKALITIGLGSVLQQVRMTVLMVGW